MGKVQDYLTLKKAKELGYPIIYFVKSTRTQVNEPITLQVVEIEKNSGRLLYVGDVLCDIPIHRYIFEKGLSDIATSVDIAEGNLYELKTGSGTGFGDLWEWTNFFTFSKEKADEFYLAESARVKKKYQSNGSTTVVYRRELKIDPVTGERYMDFSDSNEDSTERIICSAIWYMDLPTQTHRPKNIDSGIVVTGLRHCNCIDTVKTLSDLRTVKLAPDGVGEHIQGFLTSDNRFVDRKRGAEIAWRMKQIKDEGRANPNKLYSEDLY